MILQAFRMSGALSHFTLRKVHPFDPTVFIAQKEAQLLRHLLPAFSLPLACPYQLRLCNHALFCFGRKDIVLPDSVLVCTWLAVWSLGCQSQVGK